MALPLYVGGWETERWIEKVFDFLVENLPDHYIVTDQGGTGEEVRFASGPDDYVEYGSIVLAPGIAAQIQICPVGDLLSVDESDQSEVRIEHFGEGGPEEMSLSREPRAYTALHLEDVVDWLAESEDVVDSETSEFFSKVRVVETTVLSHATSEWPELAAKAMGFQRHHTRYSVVDWLQQLEDSVVFPDSGWTEDRVRALFLALGDPLRGWDRTWSALERRKDARAKQVQTLPEKELRELISERYPFPLAFSLRTFETEPGYPKKLHCAENVLAYLGTLGIALARDAGLSLSSEDGLGKHLKGCWSRGVSAGHWVRILRETARSLRASDGPGRLPEFPSVYWRRSGGESGLGKVLKDIPRIRNDFHHSRTSPNEYEEAGAELHEKLMTLYAGLRFLATYPLWYVTDCAKRRGSPLWQVTYKLCAGDNAQFRTLDAEVAEYLYRDSVYLKTPGHLVDLTPWIVMRTCPKCGSQAMFFVEKIDPKDEEVTYKSFNRGHIDQTDQYWAETSSQLGL
jgi:hypothetical protein